MSEGAARGGIRQAMRACVRRHGSRPALALGGGAETLSYTQLGDRIEDACRLLRDRFPGDEAGKEMSRHIGFCLANGAEYVIFYFGALFAGHLPFLLDAHVNIGEIEAIQSDCGLDALIVQRTGIAPLGLAGLADPVTLSDDVALVPMPGRRELQAAPRATTEVCRFTSGTTGRPKCLEFSGQAVVSAAENWVRGTSMTGEDRVLCLAALSNGLAFNTSLLSTFLAGGELHFLKGAPLTRVVARRIAEHAITRLVAFPALYRHFAAPGSPDRADMASLRQVISAGAPLWPDVREEFRSRYGLDISDYYGIAETGPCTFERDATYHHGLGEPLPGVEIRIVPGPPEIERGEIETGEVLVRTASMASGYLNHPELFAQRLDADGFYHSGDRGHLTDGRLHLVGRTQDHINVAGRKVDPTEIANVVSALEGVQEVVVFPDEDLNRETLVHVVVVSGRRELTSAMVADACRTRLAPYKVPGRISFVPQIPRNGIGKPRIAALRETLQASRAS